MMGRYRRELSVAGAYGLFLILLAVAAPRFFGSDPIETWSSVRHLCSWRRWG